MNRSSCISLSNKQSYLPIFHFMYLIFGSYGVEFLMNSCIIRSPFVYPSKWIFIQEEFDLQIMVSSNALPPSSSLSSDKHFTSQVQPPKSSRFPSNKSKPPQQRPPPHSPPRHGGNLAQPPPKQHEKSPTKPSTESTNNYPSLKSPLVIGISAGVGVLIVLLLIACICSTRKKKKKIHDPMHYYADSGPKGTFPYWFAIQNKLVDAITLSLQTFKYRCAKLSQSSCIWLNYHSYGCLQIVIIILPVCCNRNGRMEMKVCHKAHR